MSMSKRELGLMLIQLSWKLQEVPELNDIESFDTVIISSCENPNNLELKAKSGNNNIKIRLDSIDREEVQKQLKFMDLWK